MLMTNIFCKIFCHIYVCLYILFCQRLIYLEAEKVRKEEEARLRKKLGAKEAAKQAEKKAQVGFSELKFFDILFQALTSNDVI